jgi:hypothetical protein
VVETRSDGDFHVAVAPDAGYGNFLSAGNIDKQDGNLVTEIMPGQHFRLPKEGERVEMFGTWVLDTNNDWNEIHPIWSINFLDRGFRQDELPPATPLYEGNGND